MPTILLVNAGESVASRVGGALLRAAVIPVAAFLLALPAVWNGYPLLFWDSADYMAMPFTGVVPPWRVASYVLLTLPAVATGTLWATIVFQCLLVAYILHEVLAALAPISVPARRVLLPVVLALVVLTGLPWFTSQVMADALAGPLVLGLATLAFAPSERLGRLREGTLALALVPAVAVHTTHVALACGFVLVGLGLAGLARLGVWRWLSVRVAPLVAVAVLGCALAGGMNAWVSGSFYISQSNGPLMLARIVQSGVAKTYLDAVCPSQPALRMCGIKDRLPRSANFFLWGGPFHNLGGFGPEMEAEAAMIVRDSLRRFPIQHLREAVALTLEQLTLVATGDGLIPLDTIHTWQTVENAPFMPRIIGAYYPGDLAAYQQSRQRRTPAFDFTGINAVHVPLAYAGYAVILMVLVIGFARRDRGIAGLALFTLLGVLANAFVCGALSNPLDRYQSRIVWIMVVAAGLGAPLVIRTLAKVGRRPIPAAAAPAVGI